MDQRGRWGLSPAMRTFAVVDAILVATFVLLVVLLRPFSGSTVNAAPSTGATSGSSSPAPEMTPDATVPPSPTDPTDLTVFRLPSGNIWCEMTTTSATCTILRFTFTPPAPPPGCSGSAGNVFTVVAGHEATFACVGGEPPAVPQGAPTLEYGQASTVGEMTCHSSTNGVTCRHNLSGVGFSMARAGYRLF
jgi:hypothetical protein